MPEKQPKKLDIIYILKILEDCSDENHKLSQNQIAELVEEKFEMKINRKTVKRNLSKLLEVGYPLVYSEHHRVNKEGKTETILTDWYYKRSRIWDDSELQVLIDSILFSNYLPEKHCMDLVKKITDLGDENMKKKYSELSAIEFQRPLNKSVFYTVYVFTEAITDKKQVSFNYFDYDTEMNPQFRKKDGEERIYIVSPYKLLSLNGRYYLICKVPEREGISHFRVDRIKNASISDGKFESVKTIKGYEKGFDLSKYVSEHPNMWSGDPVRCTFKCPKYLMNDIVDWFGNNITIMHSDDDNMEVSVRASEESMLHWAVQYAESVEVISPVKLRKRIADTLTAAAEKYSK
ncbi:MAG: WYL domain-containing protein [Oscillospiraceae bacterium]|nr:WYL domain-containing protein [Oscillospiraceae bacterium]